MLNCASQVILLTMLASLTACQTRPKGPEEAGRPVYYDPERAISSDGLVYPHPR